MNGLPFCIDALSMPDATPLCPDEAAVAREKTSSSRITTHRHSFAEIILFTEGEGTQVVNDVEYPIRPGTLSLILPSDVHELIASTTHPVIQRRCSFDLSVLMKALGSCDAFEMLFDDYDALASSFHCTDEQFETARTLFDQAEAAAEGKTFGTAFSVYAAVQLLTYYVRTQPGRSEEDEPPSAGVWKAARKAFSRAGDRKLTITKLAQEVGLSSKQLQAGLLAEFDMNFTALMAEIRALRTASMLLAFPDWSVGEIRESAGFGSDATMFRLFNARFGMSPSAYRDTYLFRSSSVAVKIVPHALSNDILIYLYEHYMNDIKLEWLANLFGVNAQQLGREFRLYLGLSFNELLTMIRIKRAKALIASTNLPIETVSKQCGFSSHRVFLGAFRGETGMSPREYRKASAAQAQ